MSVPSLRTWPWLLALSIVGLALFWLGTPLIRVLISGTLLLAPGYLLWLRIKRDIHLPAWAHLGIIIGLSLSAIPVIFLWANTLGLVLLPLVLQLLLAGTSLLSVWCLARQPQGFRGPFWLAGGLLFVGLLTLGIRLYEIRDIVLPLWVDSVHHALLIRIIGETGHYPTSLRPYVAVDRIPYHWGYHALLATWRSLTGLSLPTLMLLTGQVLNALHILTIYSLGSYLLRSPLAGLLAALTTGLLSLMPAYYVTWGRYTQLTGLLLLPALIMLTCLLVERPRLSLPILSAAAICLAGLILIHYRVLIFYVGFMIAYCVIFAVRSPRQVLSMAGRLSLIAFLGLILAGPWIFVLLRQILIPIAQRPQSLIGDDSYNGIDRTLLWATNNPQIFVVAGLGFALACILRRRRVLVVGLWIGVLALLANPDALGLRPLWLINNHSVLITLFLPMSLLAGFGVRQAIRGGWRITPTRLRPMVHYGIGILFLLFAARGAWQFRSIINPITDLATPPDIPALAWVADHTPPDARFLISATPWLPGVYRGTDAGWWITPLTGRWTSTPPVLYTYGDPVDVARITAISKAVNAIRPNQDALLDSMIKENHISYIFIGSKGGSLKGEMFWGRPGYTAVYDHDGVLIFAVTVS